MLFSASFKLALMCCSCLHHLLPWVASSRYVMHHTWLSIMSCYVWCVYYVVCFFSIVPVSLRSWGFVRLRLVRLRGFIHGLVLLPSGISGKMTATLDLTTIIAMLVASFYGFAALPIFCSSSLPNCHEPLTFDTLPSKPLFGYVTALLSPSYSIVSCRWSWRLLHGGQDYVGISQYLLFN